MKIILLKSINKQHFLSYLIKVWRLKWEVGQSHLDVSTASCGVPQGPRCEECPSVSLTDSSGLSAWSWYICQLSTEMAQNSRANSLLHIHSFSTLKHTQAKIHCYYFFLILNTKFDFTQCTLFHAITVNGLEKPQKDASTLKLL